MTEESSEMSIGTSGGAEHASGGRSMDPRMRRLLRHFKPRPLLARLKRPRLVAALARRGKPVSRSLGCDRGTPIDRFWIDRFIEANADAMYGRCLEVGADRYVRTYGRPTQVDILDVDDNNDLATVHGDLCHLPQVPDGTYDCVVLTQVLQYIEDLVAALATCARILAPGGTLLVTVPATQPLDPFTPPGLECWRFTPRALRWLAAPHFPAQAIEVSSCGNAAAGAAFFVGLAQEDLRQRELVTDDPMFPCVATLRATREATPGTTLDQQA